MELDQNTEKKCHRSFFFFLPVLIHSVVVSSGLYEYFMIKKIFFSLRGLVVNWTE